MNVHQTTIDDIERYARVSLFSLEMSRRFNCAPRYIKCATEITPAPIYIRAIPNYLDAAVEVDASRGFQHLSSDCYLVAIEDEDGIPGGRRFLMSGDELRSSYRPITN